ncbi:MAG: hypothetical protein IPG97_15605 [Microthrixaceae bacterium]|nr:hypothetical protein [Microthrixaceae bacterium]
MTDRLDLDRLVAAACSDATRGGCNCAPEVELAEVADGVWRASVAHDPWCRLLAQRARPWN